MKKPQIIFKNHGLKIVYGIAVAACLAVGWILQHKAFTPASPAAQAFAIAFVQDQKAVVSLTAGVNPNYPWSDSLKIHVMGVPIQKSRWLLIVECPSRSANSRHPGLLLSEPAAQTTVSATPVTVYSGTTPSRNVKLGCFIRTRSNSINNSNTPGYASIGGVTLPSLETDQAMQTLSSAPTLYEDQSTSASPIHLVQVFPGAVCPNPVLATARPTPTPSTTSSAANASPSTPPSSTSAGSTTPAPSAGIPGCFGQAPQATEFAKYYVPASLQTKEVLTDVNLRGYQVESIFPAPQITNYKGSLGQGADEKYSWSSISSLSPSLIVSNLSGEQTISRYTFLAGILLGIAGGAAASFLKEIWPVSSPGMHTKKKGATASGEATARESAVGHDDVSPTG